MKEPENYPSEDLPDELLEQAAEWFFRLQSSEGGGTTRAAHQAWLNADPQHARAFDEIRRLWEATAAPAAAVAVEAAAKRRPSQRQPLQVHHSHGRRWLRLAAAAAVVAGFAFSSAPTEISLRLSADHLAPLWERDHVMLDDGSAVDLDAGAAISIDFGARERRVALLRGRAWFDVSADRKRPFVIDVGVGQIRVTGTSFGVERRDKDTVVSVSEGALILIGASDKQVSLPVGRTATLSERGVGVPSDVDTGVVSAWRRDQVIVYDAPLADLIRELDHRRPGTIVIADASLAQRRISGVFSTKDEDRALEAIAASLSLDIIRLTDFLVILR